MITTLTRPQVVTFVSIVSLVMLSMAKITVTITKQGKLIILNVNVNLMISGILLNASHSLYTVKMIRYTDIQVFSEKFKESVELLDAITGLWSVFCTDLKTTTF